VVYRAAKKFIDPSVRTNPIGRPSLLNHSDLELIRNLITAEPDLYLDELLLHFKRLSGKNVSISTLCRGITRLKITRKKTTSIAREAQLSDQIKYIEIAINFRKEQLLFVDETHVDNRTGQRKFARAKAGIRARRSHYFHRGQKLSCAAALHYTKLVSYEALEGAYTTEDFNEYIANNVLPHMKPYPGECSVLVMDGCSIHKSGELMEMVRERGCLLLMTPPYSPAFNPIENCFSSFKAFIKRHSRTLRSRGLTLPQIVDLAFKSIRPTDCEHWVQFAGYK